MDVTETAAEIRSLEEGLWIPETRFDRDWMDSVLAPGFAKFGRSGDMYSRDQVLEIDEGFTHVGLPLPEFAVDFIEDNVAKTTYKIEVHFTTGVEWSDRKSTWIHIDGRWRLLFHRGTLIAPPKP